MGVYTVGFINSVIRAFEADTKTELYKTALRQRKAALDAYWERYWSCGLVVWEIVHANQALLKIQPQKEPRWLKPPLPENKSLGKFEYILYRQLGNTPNADGAITPHKVAQKVYEYLILCGFSGVKVKCEETSYTYIVTVGGSDFKLGRPMSSKVGRLSVNQFYDAANDTYYNAFAVTYFDDSQPVELKDNTPINLYHQGQFIQTVTMRDIYGNISLSRLPFKPCADYGYLVIV
jgi:hypothetical protein